MSGQSADARSIPFRRECGACGAHNLGFLEPAKASGRHRPGAVETQPNRSSPSATALRGERHLPNLDPHHRLLPVELRKPLSPALANHRRRKDPELAVVLTDGRRNDNLNMPAFIIVNVRDHHLSPAALFEACEKAKVKKVIQISAISADKEIGTAYALSKLAADEDLRKRKLDWVVLRPSLVMAANAYGGTALLRKLCTAISRLP